MKLRVLNEFTFASLVKISDRFTHLGSGYIDFKSINSVLAAQPIYAARINKNTKTKMILDIITFEFSMSVRNIL